MIKCQVCQKNMGYLCLPYIIFVKMKVPMVRYFLRNYYMLKAFPFHEYYSQMTSYTAVESPSKLKLDFVHICSNFSINYELFTVEHNKRSFKPN